MALDTKTLKELEQLAHNLRQQIRLHAKHSKLEEVELREVEEWIAVRRRNGEGEKAAALQTRADRVLIRRNAVDPRPK